MNRDHLGIIFVWSIFVIVSINIMNIPLNDCNNLMNDQDGSGKAQCLNHHQEYVNQIHFQIGILLAIMGFTFPGITTIKCLLYIQEDKKQKEKNV